MNRNYQIKMIFYSHPWTIPLLASEGVIDKSEEAVLVEVSDNPHLSVLCQDPGMPSRSVLPLMRQPTSVRLRQLAKNFSLLPAPLILAPNPVVSVALLMDALRVLDVRQDDCRCVYLLCHISQAKTFAPVLSICDSFHFIWDVADYPGDELLECIQTLTASGAFASDSLERDGVQDSRWGGFTLCNHRLRATNDSDYNRNIFKQSMAAAGI